MKIYLYDIENVIESRQNWQKVHKKCKTNVSVTSAPRTATLFYQYTAMFGSGHFRCVMDGAMTSNSHELQSDADWNNWCFGMDKSATSPKQIVQTGPLSFLERSSI